MYRTLLLTSLFLSVMLVTGASSPLQGDVDHMAQEAPPAITFPVTPDPAHCTVEPRPADTLTALLGTPTATHTPASPIHAGEPAPVEVLLGRPASANIETAITATLYELQACFNAGDFRRAFALATDTFLRNFADQASLTAQDLAFFTAEPTPVPEEARTAILAVTDVSVMSNGRAGAFIVTDNPFTGADTVYMTFVQERGRWLVDEVVEFVQA